MPPILAAETALESVARPKQARSRETLQRILEAAEALILEKGLADASIPEIVRRAGSSVGGFYARFQDKDELLRALEERFFHDLDARVDALADAGRWEGAPVAPIVAACAAELVEVARTRRNLVAAFLARASRDEGARAEALRFRAGVAERVARLLLARAGEMRHPEPALAVDLGVHLAFGLMLQMVLAGEVRAAGRALSDAELARELTRNMLRFLGVPDGDAASDVTALSTIPAAPPGGPIR